MKARLLIAFIILFPFSAPAQDWKELSDSLIFYYTKKDFDKALPWAEKATVATKEKFGAEHPVYSSYLAMLAGLYINTQQLSKAVPVLIEALIIYKKNVGEEHKDFIQTLTLLAVTYSNIGQNYKAEPLLVQATAIYKKNMVKKMRTMQPASINWARYMKKWGNMQGLNHCSCRH